MNDVVHAEHVFAKTLQVVGVACGLGAQDQRCQNGPDALRSAKLIEQLRSRGFSAEWADTIRPAAGEAPLEAVAATCRRLAQRTKSICQRDGFPVVLGGDHSSAIGTWKGIAQALRPRGALGLIWIDAHMDAHTPHTTPSGALHGMPLACLLGHGEASLTSIADHIALDPAHVCLIGVRSFEQGEAELLRRLGVRIYFMQDVASRGLDAVMREAVDHVQKGTAAFGVTLDLDALDPSDAPGVGSPVPGGLAVEDLLGALGQVSRHPALAGVEIVEYNPERDREAVTAAVVADMLDAMLAGHRVAH